MEAVAAGAELEQKTAEILKPFGDYGTPGVCEPVVQALRAWLEKAERGEIAAVALAGVRTHDGGMSTLFEVGSGSCIVLYAAASFVAHRIAKAIDD